MRKSVILGVITVVVVGCGSTAEVVKPQRPANRTCLAKEPPPPSGVARLERVFRHAAEPDELIKAIQLLQSPIDDDRWYLALQDGLVWTFVSDAAETGFVEALDLSDRIRLATPENGLISVALHPRLDEEPYAFVVYTAPIPDSGRFWARVSRFEVDEDHTMDPDTEVVLFDVEQRVQAHSVNHVAFGPDELLYISVGEDTNPPLAQDPTNLYGSILRIDVDTPDPERETPYSIPSGNPFSEGGGAPEVYAYGFRNPWRFSFDRDTGDLIVGDVGQDRLEEIDIVVAGGNYGWPVVEGTKCFPDDPCDQSPYIPPVVEYTHAEGLSITAGYRYRGEGIPELTGRYVFADFTFGKIWSGEAATLDDAIHVEIEPGFNIPSFAEDDEGELYVLRYSQQGEGGIYKIVPNDADTSDFPELLSETGCVDPANPKAPATGVIPYAPIAQLWSDGAEKERYLAIPDDQRIALAENGDFDLPTGSVLIKHFEFGGLYHETRLLMRTDDGWAGYSYEWNADQSDARLLQNGKATLLENGVRWQYPSRSECMVCHTEVAGRILGLEAAQLDHPIPHGDDEPENQLGWLFDRDFFSTELATASLIPGREVALVDPLGEADVAPRARAYLHANCAMCHQPGAMATTSFDLRHDVPFADMGVCDTRAERVLWGFSVPPARQRVVTPGSPDASVVYLRISTRTLFQMPPLGSGVIDQVGLELIGDWITAIPGCSNQVD